MTHPTSDTPGNRKGHTMTTSASVTTMDETRRQLDGQLLLPGDAGYDDARAVWNALVDPAAEDDHPLCQHQGRGDSGAHGPRA